jgi:hypothetical protein
VVADFLKAPDGHGNQYLSPIPGGGTSSLVFLAQVTDQGLVMVAPSEAF